MTTQSKKDRAIPQREHNYDVSLQTLGERNRRNDDGVDLWGAHASYNLQTPPPAVGITALLVQPRTSPSLLGEEEVGYLPPVGYESLVKSILLCL